MSAQPEGGTTEGGPDVSAAGRYDVSDVSAERRRSPRYPVTCPVWFINEDGSAVIRSRTENVSTSGAYILLPVDSPLQIGQKVAMRMALPHESEHTYVLTSYDGAATVVRSVSDQQAGSRRVGVGVRFEKAMRLDVMS